MAGDMNQVNSFVNQSEIHYAKVWCLNMTIVKYSH